MLKTEDYFKYEYLDDLAIKEKIYYSPSVGWDKINSKRVNINKIQILNDIQDKVLNKKYQFVPYKIKLLLKNKDSKPRKTCIPTIKDRIVISAVKRYLYDIYKEVNFNISANNIVKDITKIINNQKRKFYIKIDLSSFFDNINHDILLEKLREKVNDIIILDLIKKMLENPQKCDETEKKVKNLIGVPQGISIATLLSNIYMHKFDVKYMKNTDIDYFRYIDDIIVFADSIEKLDEIFNEMKYDLERRNLLIINQEKTKRGSVDKGLEYLGYKFIKDIITVRDSSILKFERNIEKVFKNFSMIIDKNENQIKKFIWLLNVKITGIIVDGKKYGWLYYFSCINDLTILKKLDLLIQKFLKRFKLTNIVNYKDIKKFIRTYYEINNNLNNSKYLLNLNNVSKEDKQNFLKDICLLENIDSLSDEELDYRYRYNLYRTLKNLEKDIDSISG